MLATMTMIAGICVCGLGSRGESGPVIGSNPLRLTLGNAPSPPAQPPVLASRASNPASGARVQFATPTYDFGKVPAGEVVKHVFTFTNVGNQTLEIASVQPSCGCTTSSNWSRTVAPGQTGSIPVQFNSASFTGPVGKSITIACNDPNQPVVMLQIKGTVWHPIEVTPRYAMFSLTTDAPSMAKTVRIVNNAEQPLTLSTPEVNHPAFTAELKTNQPGREFELIVRTAPPLSIGNQSGIISLKTSSTNMPTISIRTWAYVQPPVLVTPAAINLPPTPTVQSLTSTVSIRNNTTNALVLTDPAVNAPGVSVQLKELQPGYYYTLTVSFPAGFEFAQGEPVELSVKSNYPRFPTIKVPVR